MRMRGMQFNCNCLLVRVLWDSGVLVGLGISMDGPEGVSVRKRSTKEVLRKVPPVEEMGQAGTNTVEKHQHSPDTAVLSQGTYWFTRVVFIRSLAFVYCKCVGVGLFSEPDPVTGKGLVCTCCRLVSRARRGGTPCSTSCSVYQHSDATTKVNN